MIETDKEKIKSAMNSIVDQVLKNTEGHIFSPEEEEKEFGFYLKYMSKHVFVGNFDSLDFFIILSEILKSRGILNQLRCAIQTPPYQGVRKPIYPDANKGNMALYLLVAP